MGCGLTVAIGILQAIANQVTTLPEDLRKAHPWVPSWWVWIIISLCFLGKLVTVHVPNPILLDKSRRKVYFMVDECESNSPREATRSSSE